MTETEMEKQAKVAVANDKLNTISASRRWPDYFNAVHRTRLKIATILFPLVIIGFANYMYTLIRIPANYTASTQGKVISMTAPSRDSQGKVTSNDRGIVSYNVNGQEYTTLTSGKIFGPTIGDTVEVRYYPSDPKQSKAKIQLQQIGALTTLYIVIPILLMLFSWRFLVNRF